MHLEYKDMPALRVVAVQHRGPYHQIGEAFARLGQVATASGLQDAPATMLAVYHDDPAVTRATELRSEAALAVAEGVAIPPGLVELRLPAGCYATTVHVGPYQSLGAAWTELRDQVRAAGYPPSNGPSYEIYRNTPETVEDAKLLTELYLPVEPGEPSAPSSGPRS